MPGYDAIESCNGFSTAEKSNINHPSPSNGGELEIRKLETL